MRLSTAILLSFVFAISGTALGGEGLPLDERVAIRVGSASAAPGDSEVLVPVSMEVLAEGPLVRRWTAFVRFDPSAMGFLGVEEVPGPYGVYASEPSSWLEEGVVSIEATYYNEEDIPSYPAVSEPIRLRFCVRGDAAPGAHPLDLLEQATPSFDSNPPVPSSYMDLEDRTFRRTLREPGSIVVAGPPVTAECPLEPVNFYRCTEYGDPLHRSVTFRIGEVTVPPDGREVIVPLSILVEAGGPTILSWHAIIRYDESALIPVKVESTMLGYTIYGEYGDSIDEPGCTVLRGWFDRSIDPDLEAVSETHDGIVANLRFCVREDAAPGRYPLAIAPIKGSDWRDCTNTYFIRDHGELYDEEDRCRDGVCISDFRPLLAGGAVTVPEGLAPGECPVGPPEELMTLSMGRTTASPGQTDVVVPIWASVKPGIFPVHWWKFLVRYDPHVLGEVRLEGDESLQGWSAIMHGQENYADLGTVSLDVGPSYVAPDEPLSGFEGPVARLRFCVFKDAPAGVHPLQFVESATMPAHPWDPSNPTAIESKCWTMGFVGSRWTGISQTPVFEHGAVEVAGEPQESFCRIDQRGELFKAAFRLSDAIGFPGGAVRIPFRVEADAEFDGLNFSVDFDEGLLEATEIEKVYRLPSGSTDYYFEYMRFDNSDENPGSAGTDEGYLAGGIRFSRDPARVLPANQEIEVLAFHFRVKPDAPTGTSTSIRFLPGGRPSPNPTFWGPVSNEMHVKGVSVKPGADAAYLYLNGSMRIVPDVSVFVRGDSNDDRAVNLGDAIFTLSNIYLGGDAPACRDASDANDDGAIDITDPIHVLGFLFLGGTRIPPPFPSCGIDDGREGPGCDAAAACRTVP
jgi:hypothetical protein